MKSFKPCLILMITLSMIVGGAQIVARADSVSALESQANADFIGELRLAAGLALVDAYIGSKSIDELEAIAGDSGNSSELRLGAATALSQLYVSGVTAGAVTQADLFSVALGGATAELRAATSSALIGRLLATATSEALNLSIVANSVPGLEELASIQAKALIIQLAVALTSGSPFSILEKVEGVAGGGSLAVGGITLDGSSETVQRALASEYLSGFYIQFGSIVFDDLEASLRDRAANGATVGIREAAAIALETVAFKGKSSAELEAYATTGGSAEFRAAAGRALARALVAEGVSRADLIAKVVSNTIFNVEVAKAAATALATVLAE